MVACFPSLCLILKRQSPIVVFAIPKYSLHIVQGILVEACRFRAPNVSSLSWTSHLHFLLVSLPLIFIFQLVLFDKIGKFVNPVVILAGKSAIELMRRIRFLVIREDLIQPTLSMLFAVVSMSTLKALEFWLEGR